MSRFYTIQAKLLVIFLLMAFVYAGGGVGILLFVHDIVGETETFLEVSGGQVREAGDLESTAIDIAYRTQKLVNETDREGLRRDFGEVNRALDWLEAVTARISREGDTLDLLTLNRLHQSIRSEVHLLFLISDQILAAGETNDAATRERKEQLLRSARSILPSLERHVGEVATAARDYRDLTIRNFQKRTDRILALGWRITWGGGLMILLATLLLGLTHRKVVVRGLVDRIAIVSGAMGRVPTEEGSTRVPVAGNDEIADMARALEVLLQQALQLRRLATIDELTGLYNRRRFFEIARREEERACRSRTRTCMLMMDIDHFKQVNDVYGHDAGDAVLVALAAALQKEVRVVDRMARMGGEEFALLMPDTPVEGGWKVAERLRLQVAALRIPIPAGRNIPITVSIGLTVVCLCETGVDAALKQADDALYQAKDAGRNRVAIYKNPMTETNGDLSEDCTPMAKDPFKKSEGA